MLEDVVVAGEVGWDSTEIREQIALTGKGDSAII